uniref:Uncharacterized protein n=1 Tax=Salix viminalis TaxID=40686 RepID=A0A6N2M0K9_SALVM
MHKIIKKTEERENSLINKDYISSCTAINYITHRPKHGLSLLNIYPTYRTLFLSYYFLLYLFTHTGLIFFFLLNLILLISFDFLLLPSRVLDHFNRFLCVNLSKMMMMNQGVNAQTIASADPNSLEPREDIFYSLSKWV